MRFSIRTKLFLFVVIVAVAYSASVGIIVLHFKRELTADIHHVTIANLKENVSNASAIINGDFEIARAAANTLVRSLAYDDQIRERFTGDLLLATVNQNTRYLSAWLSLELSAFDPSWSRDYGRKRYTYFRAGEPIIDIVNQDGDVVNSLYHNLKLSKTEQLTEPYLLSSTSSVKDGRNDYLGTSVCVPLLRGDKFLGIAGMDITLDGLNFVADLKPFAGAQSFLISSEGTVVSHPNRNSIGKKISEVMMGDLSDVLKDIGNGTARSWTSDEAFIAVIPLKIGTSNAYWSIGTIVPKSVITSRIDTIVTRTVLFSACGLLLLTIIVYFVARAISARISLVNEKLKDLAVGRIRKDATMGVKGNDELSEMVVSVNSVIANLSDKVDFAVDIGNGKFDTSFTPSGDDDALGIALQTMRSNLKSFREEEQRRKWTNEGLALINDALRKKVESRDEYCVNVLKVFIKYLKANQGAVFITVEEEEDKFLELECAIAYDRRKYINRRIPWGSELIGQAVAEKEVVHLKEVPKDFVKITSGLGEAVPRTILIVPLINDEQIVGALEIASFESYEDHQLEFVERAREIIGSALSTQWQYGIKRLSNELKSVD